MIPTKKKRDDFRDFEFDYYKMRDKLYYAYIDKFYFNFPREELEKTAWWVSQQPSFFESIYHLNKEKNYLLDYNNIVYLKQDWIDLQNISMWDVLKEEKLNHLIEISKLVHETFIKWEVELCIT